MHRRDLRHKLEQRMLRAAILAQDEIAAIHPGGMDEHQSIVLQVVETAVHLSGISGDAKAMAPSLALEVDLTEVRPGPMPPLSSSASHRPRSLTW